MRTGDVVALEDSKVLFVERADFQRFAAGFKVLDDYFRTSLRAHFPPHMLPEQLRGPEAEDRKKDRA